MRELLAHASTLEVSVHVAHLPTPYRGFYDHPNRRVVYDFGLTPNERRSTVAHELGHVFHGHTGHGIRSHEDAADRYAARLLIQPSEYARLERVHNDVQAIADELGVEAHVVRTFQQLVTRLDGVTYARSLAGAFRLRWGNDRNPT